jgi:multisubunit Na+/H+ antiporter MnhB subunit
VDYLRKVSRQGAIGCLRICFNDLADVLNNPTDRALAIQRLTALWALNECGLGGLLHALNSPFTGLVVGSIAMICIALICSLSGHSWKAVMTSLVIVLIIKGLVSPHSSPTAYVAVAFQGVSGALIFRYVPGLLAGSLFFFTLGQVESAMQRLIMLTLLYGQSLWNAVDIWGKWVGDKWGVVLPASSSTMIIVLYLLIHVAAGLLVGWWCYRIIRTIQRQWGDTAYQLTLSAEDRKAFMPGARSASGPWKRLALLATLIMLITLAYGVLPGENDWQKAMVSILRVVVILVLWFVFIAPMMVRFMHRLLRHKRQQLAAEVTQVMDMFPALLWILDKAWTETRNEGAWTRGQAFLTRALLYALQYKTHDADPGRAGEER